MASRDSLCVPAWLASLADRGNDRLGLGLGFVLLLSREVVVVELSFLAVLRGVVLLAQHTVAALNIEPR
jgi:hypothetical protein